MQLTDEQKQRLAELLSDRLIGFATRRATADAAGMSDAQVAGEPVTSWRLLIDEALERGRFLQLLKAAARQAPGDVDLDALAESAERGALHLPEPPPPPPPWRVLVFGTIGALAIVGVVFLLASWLQRAGGPDDDAGVATTGEAPKVEVRSGLKPAPKPSPRPTAPAPPPEPEVEPEPEPAPKLRPGKFIKIPEPPEPAAPEPAAPTEPTTASVSGCSGYAYAGTARPGVSGGQWTLTGGVNVRAWYPTAENGFDARGTLVCTLAAGATVPVGEPIEVPGGAWWVPVLGAP